MQAMHLPSKSAADTAHLLDAMGRQAAAVRTRSLEPTVRVRWAGCPGSNRHIQLTPLANHVLFPDIRTGGLGAMRVAHGEQAVQVRASGWRSSVYTCAWRLVLCRPGNLLPSARAADCDACACRGQILMVK